MVAENIALQAVVSNALKAGFSLQWMTDLGIWGLEGLPCMENCWSPGSVRWWLTEARTSYV